MFSLLKDLKKYDPKNLDKIKSKKEPLINAEKLYNNRNNVIKVFEDGVFLFNNGFQKKKEADMSDNALPNWIKEDKKDLIG